MTSAEVYWTELFQSRQRYFDVHGFTRPFLFGYKCQDDMETGRDGPIPWAQRPRIYGEQQLPPSRIALIRGPEVGGQMALPVGYLSGVG